MQSLFCVRLVLSCLLVLSVSACGDSRSPHEAISAPPPSSMTPPVTPPVLGAEKLSGFDGRILKEAFMPFDGSADAASPTVCGRFG